MVWPRPQSAVWEGRTGSWFPAKTVNVLRGCASKQDEETIALFLVLRERPQLERGSGEDGEGEDSKSCLQVGKSGFLAASVRKLKP